jgi:predicted transcriptional regulator of viral defense system
MTHRRREFSAQTKRDAYDRSGGICECHRVPCLKRPKGCGAKLGIANTFYEHVTTDFHSNDNCLSNCAVLARTCWREKTSQHDLPSIAKTKRLIDSARGIRQVPSQPIAGTIASGWKHRMNGGWERR